MALPNTHYNISDYFEEALMFLKEYEWIYNYPNTDILVQGVLEKIPKEWKIYFKSLEYNNLKDIALCQPKDDCPQSLNKFFLKIQVLSITADQFERNGDCNLGRNCGLSTKKQHEIVSLAPVVAEICEKINSKEVIDIGAGLGYLSYLISEKHDYSVLAIEGSIEKIELAMKTKQKKNLNPKQNVTFHHHFITEGSLHKIRDCIEKKFLNADKICICGLHACADLSAVILDLFLKLEHVRALVIMPCCYHRLNLENIINGKEYFTHFPKSNTLKSRFEKHDAAHFLRRPFLRLSCQQTVINFINMSEKEHRSHAENLLMRSILQQAAEEVECNVSRLKRKTGKARDGVNSFDFYLENLNKTHKLIPRTSSKFEELQFKKKMLEIWESERENLFLFEVLTALQNAIQSMCENISLQDRVQYLKENGVHCYIRKVTDDKISPRCHALVAIKE